MTPINLISFFLALALVDASLAARRAVFRSHDLPVKPNWLPSFLSAAPAQAHAPESWYHSKQRELLRFETAEAFRLRDSVLLGIAGVLVVGAVGGGLIAWTAWDGVVGQRSV